MRTSTRQDWLAAAALLAGLVAVYLIPPATTGPSAARAVAAMAIAALIALAVSSRPFTFALRVRTGFILLVALALWYVLTRLWAVDPAGSMVESSRLCAFVLFAWAAHTTVVGTAARRLLLGGVAVYALAISAPLLVDLVRDGAPNERVAGALGYWNATGVVALVLVPVAVALAGSGKRWLIVLAGVLIPIAGVVAVATASRGALLSLVVALIVQALLDPDYRGGLPRALVALGALALVIFGLAIDGMPWPLAVLAPALVAIGGFGLIRQRRTRRERRLALAPQVTDEGDSPSTPARRRPGGVQIFGGVILLALAGLLFALVYSSNDDAVSDLPRASSNEDVSRLASIDDGVRFEWWRDGIEMWKQAPLHGRGGGAFALLHAEEGAGHVGHVHSLPIEVLLESGIIGFLAFAGAAILLLRVLRRGHRSPERALAGAICALLLTQAMVDWTLSLPQVAVLLAIAIPLALPSPPTGDDADAAASPGTQDAVPVWAAITMLIALALATTVALTPVLASMLADQAAKRFDDGEPLKAAQLAEQSLILVPSFETLQLQVIALQAAGDDDAARALLRSHETIWFTRLDGVHLAEPFFAENPEQSPRIARQIKKLERERALAAPS